MDTSPRAWMLPDEPMAVRLMNTVWADSAGVHDDLLTAADVDAWLDSAGMAPGTGATPEDLALARSLRDAARRLAAHVTADSRKAAASAAQTVSGALAAVNAAASGLPLPQLTLQDGRLQATAGSAVPPVAAALAQVAEATIELAGGHDAARLMACHAPGCVLYFLKTHPRREWCSVTCGNRVRAARHYERIRAGTSSPARSAASGPPQPPGPRLVH